jgi:hypothetical protein
MDYFIILHKNQIITKSENQTNLLPFSLEEAQQVIKSGGWKDAKCINISEDLRIQGMCIEKNHLLEERQQLVYTWRNKFFDNNINGFEMPRKVDSNEEYILQLKIVFKAYEEAIDKIAFKYEYNLVKEVNQICQKILKIIDLYLAGDIDDAKKIIALLINEYKSDAFWVSKLDRSYAFRGVAPFLELHSQGYKPCYDLMMKPALDFYRARPSNIKKDRKEVLHIPYRLLNLINEQRFSLQNQPCLYLGTSSYVCWEECRKPDLHNFYISGFKVNEEGKKLKIFNLVVSEHLVNGICQKQDNDSIKQMLQNSMIKLLPIVLATSFVVNDKSPNRKKYEYIISQLVMQSLSDLNIDGVAYLSKRGKDDFQYPQGVNIAIPVFDINSEKDYGDVCDKFVITEPEAFNIISKKKTTSQSYIHQAFDGFNIADYKKNFSQYAACDDNITAEEYKSYR